MKQILHNSFLVKKSDQYLKFPLRRFIVGMNKIRSVLSELPWVKEDIVWKTYKLMKMTSLRVKVCTRH